MKLKLILVCGTRDSLLWSASIYLGLDLRIVRDTCTYIPESDAVNIHFQWQNKNILMSHLHQRGAVLVISFSIGIMIGLSNNDSVYSCFRYSLNTHKPWYDTLTWPYWYLISWFANDLQLIGMQDSTPWITQIGHLLHTPNLILAFAFVKSM